MGDYAQAEPLYGQALAITRRSLALTSAAQSERQQIAMASSLRYQLDSYLSLTGAHSLPAASAYDEVLVWKGQALARQRAIQASRDDQASAPLWSEFQTTSQRLAALTFATPTPAQQEAWRRQIRELSERRERLEAELSQKSAAFRGAKRLETLKGADLQAVLPAGTVLIDVLEYWQITPPAKPGKPSSERHVVAFVVQKDRALARVSLGPAEPLNAAVSQWRQALEGGGPESAAGAALRRLVWEPLRPHLDGVSTVLVSPDGALAWIPWGALPGDTPGQVLLEERRLVLVPVPQLLPELLSERPPGEPSLLALGSVAYDEDPGAVVSIAASRAAPRSGGDGRLSFSVLDGTGPEIEKLAAGFRQAFPEKRVELLRGGSASEARFRADAPRYRYLHLATHGFFAPEPLRPPRDPGRLGGVVMEGREEAVGFHPGLLSGLALAGANRAPEPDKDDGILTALEVSGLDLSRTELVVLSACETGLGAGVQGEGMLGLQRAFQAAGARAVVSSLWPVDDAATQALMGRFYGNLWEKKLGKLEALREAQLWMREHWGRAGEGTAAAPDEPEASDAEEEPARAASADRGGRGALIPAEKPAPSRAPAGLWAGFVLSGEWR
jgi:CHAT domain-containing protein